MMRSNVGLLVVVLICCLACMALEHASAGTVRCPITGKTYRTSGKSCSSGGAGVRMVKKPPKPLMRTMDHTGRIAYTRISDTASKQKRMDKAYQDALKRWERMQAAFLKMSSNKDKMYTKIKPVKPVVEAVANDKDRNKDYAVYEIKIGDTTIREIANANAQVHVESRANAKHADLHNKWVKSGKPESTQISAPVVKKVACGMSRTEAGRKLAELGKTSAKLPVSLASL